MSSHSSPRYSTKRSFILFAGAVVFILLMGRNALAVDIIPVDVPVVVIGTGETSTTCTPSNLAVYDTRVHVKCVESVGGIQWFAISTADSAKAARVLSIINSAMVTGRPLFINYNPTDTSGDSFGCQASDCRIITGIGFWQ